MLHEIAHGYTAYKLGDITAKKDGRLSLNPLRHIDPIGFIMLLILHIGWARPVRINPYNLKDPKKDMAVISLAGPIMNFVLSILFFIPLYIYTDGFHTADLSNYTVLFFYIGMTLNLSLAVFNILPLPPLDGSKVFGSLFPDRIYAKIVMFNPNISMGILILLSFTNILSNILSPMINSVFHLYLFLADYISGLL